MNPTPVQNNTPVSETTTYGHPTFPRESETDPDAPVIYTQTQLYLSSPGLYETELDTLQDEASLDMYMRYYYSIHVPSLRYSTRTDLRHIEDEVAHYIIWLESVPPSPILSLISPVGPIHPSSCIFGFLFGEELSGWLTARRRPPLTRGWVPTLPFTPRAHLPHTGSTVTVPPDSWTTRFQPWESDWAPPRLRMCARILTCLQLSRVAPAPHGLLATMRDFHEEFEYQYLPHTRTRPHVPLPGLPWTHRFSARLAILRSDNTVSTSIHIAFDSYTWAVAHNITTRSWNTARRSHVIHDTRRFSSHDPLGNPWEPDGYLEECGRPVRHDAHTLPPRDDWHQRAPFGIAASVFSIPLPPATLDAIRALFQADAQRVVLEFYSHETAPRLVLAGDTMVRRPISIPDPHLTSRHPLMPEVVAATSLSRRGYSSHSPLSRATGGDMFVSFHAGLGPPTHFEDERIDAREDDALWGLARRALPRYVSDGNALTRPPASGEGSTRPGSPSLRHVEVVIQTRPARVNRNPNLEAPLVHHRWDNPALPGGTGLRQLALIQKLGSIHPLPDFSDPRNLRPRRVQSPTTIPRPVLASPEASPSLTRALSDHCGAFPPLRWWAAPHATHDDAAYVPRSPPLLEHPPSSPAHTCRCDPGNPMPAHLRAHQPPRRCRRCVGQRPHHVPSRRHRSIRVRRMATFGPTTLPSGTSGGRSSGQCHPLL